MHSNIGIMSPINVGYNTTKTFIFYYTEKLSKFQKVGSAAYRLEQEQDKGSITTSSDNKFLWWYYWNKIIKKYGLS